MVLRKCVERFDSELVDHMPRGWSVREHAKRTLVTPVGAVAFERAVFLDELGRRRAWADELPGVPPRARLSACAFLWIASRAAELSYRKAAAEFAALTSAPVSRVAVMDVVHREGALLRESGGEFARGGERVSREALFLESDGLWAHLQERERRGEALPRSLYEQARKAKSFELEIAALYAGKARVAPGRYRRAGLCPTCLDGDADAFRERAWRMLCENCEEGDVGRIAVGGDGAERCGPGRVEERAAAKMRPGSARDKVADPGSCIANHAAGVRPPRRGLGTMEGTNSHVGAARLKGQGRSWSRQCKSALFFAGC